MGDVNVTSEDAITIDTYHVKINTTDTDYGTNRSSANSDTFLPLKLNRQSVGGGPDAKATYNIPYSLMIPKFETMVPTGCTIKAQARTVSAASVNGSEAAYRDLGMKVQSDSGPLAAVHSGARLGLLGRGAWPSPAMRRSA